VTFMLLRGGLREPLPLYVARIALVSTNCEADPERPLRSRPGPPGLFLFRCGREPP